MRKIDTSEQTDQRAVFLLAEHFGIVSESQIAEARELLNDGETACEVLQRLQFVDASDWMHLRKRVSDVLNDLDRQRPALWPHSGIDHESAQPVPGNETDGTSFTPTETGQPNTSSLQPQSVRRPPPASGEAFLEVEFFDDDVQPPSSDEDTAVPEAAPSLIERGVDRVISLVWPILERYPAPVTILVVVAIFVVAWYLI